MVQGRRSSVIENRVSSSKYPVRLFLDEYGMYGVKGFFVLVSLIRSYGFHILFGAQTAGMFKRAGGQEEYEALMGNLNTKVILKNEDHEESLRLVLGRTGKVFHARQDRMENGIAGAEHITDGRIEEGDMVNARMLASANPGEGLYISGGDVHPFRALNLQIPELKSVRLNSFAQVLAPSEHEILSVTKIHQPREEDDLIEYSSDGKNALTFDILRKGIDLASEKNVESIAKQVMLAFGLMQIGHMNRDDSELTVETGDEESFSSSNDVESDSINDELIAFHDEPDFQIDELDLDEEIESDPVDDDIMGDIDFSDFDESENVDDEFPDIANAIDFDSTDIDNRKHDQEAIINTSDNTSLDESVFTDTPAKMFEDEMRKKFASTFIGDTDHVLAQADGHIDLANILDSTIESMTTKQEPLQASGKEGKQVIIQALSYPHDIESYNPSDDMLSDAISKIKRKISEG